MSKNIKGTKENDILNGDDSNNKIDGKDGDDQLFGWEGNDELKGGKGDDLLDGGEGNDSLKGEKGTDTLFGGSGMDVLDGGDDDDTLNGGIEDDLIDGGKGDDLLEGSEGNDILAGDKGDDTLKGGDGDDVLLGDGKLKGSGKGWGSGGGTGKGTGKGTGPGKGSGGGKGSEEAEWNNWATIGSGSKGTGPKGTGSKGTGPKGTGSKGTGSGSGDEGNDYLDGGAGNDLLYAWSGDDTGHYQAAENAGAIDLYDGGDGVDTLELELTLEEWMDPVFQGDLENYLQFLEDNTDADSGEANDQAFTFNAFGLTASAWENLAITVDGVDFNPADDAVIAKDDNFTAVEDGTPTSGNVLDDNGNGADEIPDFLRSVSLASDAAGTLLSLDSEGNFEYDSSSAFQHLAAGETEDDSFTYTVEDADGDTDTATATITVTGVNDMPVVATSGLTGTVTEMLDPLGNLTDSGSLSFSDVDLIDSHSISSITASAGALGSLTSSVSTDTTGSGTGGVINWDYSVPAAAIEYLAKDETKLESFVVTLDDGNGGTVDRTVDVTITGTNDGPVVTTSDLSAPVTEMLDPLGNLTSNGNIYFTDVDINNSHSISSVTASAGVLGSLSSSVSIDTTGSGTGGVINWDYSVLAENVEYLAEDQTKLESFVVTLDDGNDGTIDHAVDVTLVGTNDGPVVTTSDLSAPVTEMLTPLGNLTSNGNIYFTDVDINNSHSISSITAPADALGSLISSVSTDTTGSGTGGIISWDYSVPAAAIEYLAKDETKLESFVVTLDDGNGGTVDRTVDVTLVGTNDAPEISIAAGNSASETVLETNVGLTTSGTLTATDADTSDVVTASVSSVVSTGNNSNALTPSNAALLSMLSVTPAVLSGTESTGSLTWNFDSAGEVFDYLAVGENLELTYTIEVLDDNGSSNTQAVTVIITGTNDGPVAEPDSRETDANTEITIDVLANDKDTDGDVLTITSATSGSGGSVEIIDNQLQFDPAGEFAHLIRGELEDVTLSYSIDDGHGGTDTSTVTITVEGTNTPPEAFDDSITVDEVSGATITVLENDIDPDPGEVLTVTGAVVVSGNGTVTTDGTSVFWDPGLYEVPTLAPNPNPNWIPDTVPFYDTLGADETATVILEYSVEDRSAVSDTATVTITVTGENDAPVAVASVGSTEENTATYIHVLASDTDIDTNDTHTLDLVNISSGNGIASIDDNFLRWDPGSDYDYLPAGGSAAVVVDYTMSDNHGAASSSTATITVSGSNDAPIADDDSDTTDENAALTLDVLANDTDVDSGDSKTLNTVSVANGSATIVNNQLLWNPGTEYDYLAAGESATTDVTYTMSDSSGASSTATATITVTGSNDAPIAVIDPVNTLENGDAITLDLLANDSDVDRNDTHTLNSVSFAAGYGAASIVGNKLVWDRGTDFDYLAAGEIATVVGSYTVSDNHGASATSTVTITVTGENDTPQALADSGQTEADTILLLDVLDNDSDVDSTDVLSITEASSTGGGSVEVVNNQLQFDPAGQYGHLNPGETEQVTLLYSLSDGNGGSNINTVTVTVVGINTDPIAEDDSARINEDVSGVQLAVLDNDSDRDPGQTLTVTSASVRSGGGSLTTDGTNLSWSNSGAFNSLSAGETAIVTLDYTVTDNLNGSDDATATITVEGSNDAPQLTSTSSSVSIDEIYNVFGSSFQHQQSGTFNFADVDINDTHTITLTPGSSSDYPYAGTLTATISDTSTGDGNGQIHWDYVVTDSDLDLIKAGQIQEQNYDITIDDGQGGTVTHRVAINLNGDHDNGDVAPGNNAPVAVDNTLFTTNYDLTGFTRNSAGDDHYYKWVGASVNWHQAMVEADAAGGYLATITTAQENEFVNGIASGNTWLGGSDAAVEGEWQWSTGPETGAAFWSGDATGDALPGSYQNWIIEQQQEFNQSEPASSWGDEYALITDDGSWYSHRSHYTDPTTTGYVVELHEEVYEVRQDATGSDIAFPYMTDPNPFYQHYQNWSYNPANGHYYKYIEGNWDSFHASGLAQWPFDTVDPNSLATAERVITSLVTITSQEENDFVTNLIPDGGSAWIGALVVDGNHNWGMPAYVGELENNGNGWSLFWYGDENGYSVNGAYENWATSPTPIDVRVAPNNPLGVEEDHLQMEDSGSWNSAQSSTGGANYVIEVGGRLGDPDMPDLFEPNEDESVIIAGADLLANDYDVDGDLISIVSVSPATAGGAELSLIDGDVHFNPGDAYQHLAQGDTFTDTFNYTITDGPTRGSYATGQATITILGVNDAPVAQNDTGATLQDSTLVLNVLGNDTDIDDGTILNIVAGTTQSSQGSTVEAFANGDIRYAAHSTNLTALAQGEIAVDTINYTLEDGFGGTDTATATVTVTGIHDKPIAATDNFSGNEDTVITGNVMTNDYDPDNGDSISMVSIGDFTSVMGGSVTINSDGSFSYTPVENYSGGDSFQYTITDTFGLTQTGRANIRLNGIADMPTVSLASGAASGFHEVSLEVTAGLTDISEGGSFVFSGVPTGVSIIDPWGKDVTTDQISFFGSSQVQDFTLVLPTDQSVDFDFDIGVTATSTERWGGSNASAVSNTENVALNVLFSSQTIDFTATDQNMWVTGDAFLFRDETKIDIVDISQGGTLVNDSRTILGQTYYVNLAASVDIDVDLVSTLELNAGSVEASVPYNIDMTSSYNANADLLHISTTTDFDNGGSQDGSFDTFGPSGSYSLDLVFDTDVSVDLDIDFRHWTIEYGDSGPPFYYPEEISAGWTTSSVVDWHPRYSGAPVLNLFSFDDGDIAGSLPIPYPASQFLTVDIAWPTIDTTSDPGADNVFTSSGTSDDMVYIELDVDELVTSRLPDNPFNQFFGGSFGPVDVNVGVELLDVKVFGAVNFVQDFTLEFEGFTTALEMEDGTMLAYTLGSEITIPNASQYDLNDDGNIDFTLVVAPDTQFTNDTDLGIDLGYFVGLIRPELDVSIAGEVVVDYGQDFLWTFDDRVQVASIDVFEDTFDFDFEVGLIAVSVDASGYIA